MTETMSMNMASNIRLEKASADKELRKVLFVYLFSEGIKAKNLSTNSFLNLLYINVILLAQIAFSTISMIISAGVDSFHQ